MASVTAAGIVYEGAFVNHTLEQVKRTFDVNVSFGHVMEFKCW